MKIPYVNLGLQHTSIKEEILFKIGDMLDSGMFILGEEVAQFEAAFARLSETKYAVGVANGTDSLILCMKALGIGSGDEVITAPNSYLASASSIAMAGATPVFADVDGDMNISPEKIEAAITDKTKAIIPVHLTGRPAKMDAIMAIAKKHNLFVIEDAAQAVGAKFKGKTVGSFGDFGSFSLHPLKNLSAGGDAGIITTDSEEHYKWLLKARNHGLKSRDELEFWSMNSRLDAMQAVILNAKLPLLPTWNKRRREIATKYNEAFRSFVLTPEFDADYESVFHAYIIQYPKRDELAAFLKEKGIDTKVHYPIAIHQQEAAQYLNYSGKLPKTDKMVEEILSIPVYPELTDEQVDYIILSVKAFFA